MGIIPPSISNNHHRTAAGLCGPSAGSRVGHLENVLGVSLGNATDATLTQDNAVVLDQFIHDLGEGTIGSKVGDRAL